MNMQCHQVLWSASCVIKDGFLVDNSQRDENCDKDLLSKILTEDILKMHF